MKEVTRQEGIRKMIRYINDNEFFWAQDMKDHLDIISDPFFYNKNGYTWNVYCTWVALIKELVAKKMILCAENRAYDRNRQYMRTIVYIEYEDLKITKGSDKTLKKK